METEKLPTRQRIARLITILVIPPLIAEVLFGSTSISMLYILIPQICIYGGVALIIHTLARRRGWSARLTLGIAFAIAEECIILQTSVSPPYQRLLFGSAPNQNYLGMFGINWTYLLWALGYESIWAIVLPIQLIELIFSSQREGPWIGRKGLIITTIVFLIPSFGIWYKFTQVGIAPGLAYEAPLASVLTAVAIISVLVTFALARSPVPSSEQKTVHSVPRPLLVGLIAFTLSLPWFSLAILPYIMPAAVPTIIPLLMGLAWASIAFILVRHWSSSRKWRDSHRLALSFGALLASMLAGFLITGPILSPFDLMGKLVLNVVAVLLLIYLARRLRQRDTIDNA